MNKITIYDDGIYEYKSIWHGWIDTSTRKFYTKTLIDGDFNEYSIDDLEKPYFTRKSSHLDTASKLRLMEITDSRRKLARKMREIQAMTDEEFVFWKLKHI